MEPFRHEIPHLVQVEKARTPHRHRMFRHDYEWSPLRDRSLEVVLLDKGEHDFPDERIVITNTAGGSHWPYAETWGETLTADQAVRLASMLQAAAYTLINEREAAKVSP